MSTPADSWRDPRVAALRVAPGGGRRPTGGADVPRCLDRLAALLGWSTPGGGAFSRMIPRGARVLVKPNWVMHANRGPWGIEPLVTDPVLVRAVVDAALRSDAASVVVGDAPIQGCDLDTLMRTTGLGAWSAALARRDPRFGGAQDFRRTTCVFRHGLRVASEDRRPIDQFVLFDLGTESLLEPVTDGRGSFRVTQYDPREMAKTHGRGRHRYLIARAAIESDVVLNMPKLKTHCKAGLTCALKNLVGINGNKEYLPHHRVRGSAGGGDCYPGRHVVKRALEYALDRCNIATSPVELRLWDTTARVLSRAVRAAGDRIGVEGAWWGNDTVWRMCLDLNRILLYGRPDGTLAETPQRAVLHVVDAIVAGQGDGPLAPEPLPLALLLAGSNAAAVDRVAAHLLGYDPDRLSLVRQAFGRFRWPIAPFTPADVTLAGDLGTGPADTGLPGRATAEPISHPPGWRDCAAGRVAPSGGERVPAGSPR
jgi:uncharacterized protein (DUF362 family)